MKNVLALSSIPVVAGFQDAMPDDPLNSKNISLAYPWNITDLSFNVDPDRPKTCLDYPCDLDYPCYVGGASGLPAWQKKRDKPLDQCVIPSDEVLAKIQKYIEPVLESFSKKNPIGFQAAFYGQGSDGKEISWDFAGGYNDLKNKTPMKSDDLIPMGSVTKQMTAGLIMKYIEEGRSAPDYYNDSKPLKITLDTPLRHYVDYLLKANMNKTMSELYPDHIGGAQNDYKWGSVLTIRNVMSMQGCMQDYNYLINTLVTELCPALTLDPYMILNAPEGAGSTGPELVTKECKIGDPFYRSYSGNGFVLLGLVLTHMQGHSDWTKMDQKELFDADKFPDLREEISFGQADKTGADLGWVHQYAPWEHFSMCKNFPPTSKLEGNTADYVELDLSQCSTYNAAVDELTKPLNTTADSFLADLRNTNSLNAWTMGNSALSSRALAKFMYKYYRGEMGVSLKKTELQHPGKCPVHEGNSICSQEKLDNSISGMLESYPLALCDTVPDFVQPDAHNQGCSYGVDDFPRWSYGLGTMIKFPSYQMNSCFPGGEANVIGHDGEDYGSQGRTNFQLDGKFATAFGMNLAPHVPISHKDTETGECQWVDAQDVNSAPAQNFKKLYFDFLIIAFNIICTGGDLSDDISGIKALYESIIDFNSDTTIDKELFNGCNDPLDITSSPFPELMDLPGFPMAQDLCSADYWNQYNKTIA